MAARILILGGLANLVYGFLTGQFLTEARRNRPDAPPTSVLAQPSPLMTGPALLGLVFALGLSSLSERTETIAAWLLVAGSAGIALNDTLDWMKKAGGAAGRRSLGFYLATIGATAMTAGLIILTVGTIAGL